MATNDDVVPVEELFPEHTGPEQEYEYAGEAGLTSEHTTAADPAAAVAVASGTEPRPRIRLGAVVWGTVVAVIAASVLWFGASSQRRANLAEWLGALTPVSITIIAILIVGAVILVVALLAVIRRTAARRAG